MSFFSDIAGQVAGRISESGSPDTVLQGVVAMLQNGGLASIVEKLHAQGLGDVVGSWISTHPNLPISPEQLKEVLGNAHIGDLAQRTGISHDDAAAQLSQLLPQLIDKLTPNGALPQGGLLEQGLALLRARPS